MKTAELLNKLAEIMAPLGADTARNDARIILAHLYDCSLNRVFLIPEASEEQTEKAIEIAKQRKDHFPIQYILGEAHFMGRKFKVTKDTLIPRCDTEPIVEAALQILKDMPKADVCDIGTGTGCIAISIAEALPQTRVCASDVYTNTLNVAKENAKGLENIEFFRGDMVAPHCDRNKIYDMVISNPPYLSDADMAEMQKELEFEPQKALYGGSDGLMYYKRLVHEAPFILRKGGYLVLEHGSTQQEEIVKMLQKCGLTIFKLIKDLGGNDRGIIAVKN